MSLFGRHHPTERPVLVAGERYILDGDATGYKIKFVRAGQDSASLNLKQVGPTFTDIGEAGKYRDWLEGGPQYAYPTGRV